jgi:hypothetical protein
VKETSLVSFCLAETHSIKCALDYNFYFYFYF